LAGATESAGWPVGEGPHSVNDFPAILNRIRADPDAEVHWLALAAHLHDNGEYDLATVVRHHWLALRDTLAQGATLEAVLAFRARDAARIARQAREAEESVLGG
jgi:hypothetical protein